MKNMKKMKNNNKLISPCRDSNPDYKFRRHACYPITPQGQNIITWAL